jgi:NlpC/P60 family putative phage cell wall peptidase
MMAVSAMDEAVIAAARRWIGTPYRHQASLWGVGCDCLGLVRGIWRELYGREPEPVPAYAADWAEASGVEAMAEAARRHMHECPPTEYRAGRLLLCRFRSHLPARHAVIATPGGRMIHAQEGAGVCEVPLSPWWRRHIAFVFAFPATPAITPSGRCAATSP